VRELASLGGLEETSTSASARPLAQFADAFFLIFVVSMAWGEEG